MELVTLGAAGTLFLSGLTGLRLAAYAWWTALGVVLSFVDVAVQRLPTRLSYTAVAGFLLLLGIGAFIDDAWSGWVRSVIGATIAACVLAACAVALPGLVHWGDVRYALAVGAAAAYVGWLGLYAAALISTTAAAVAGIGLLAVRHATLATQLPQGPFLFGGTLVTVVLLAT